MPDEVPHSKFWLKKGKNLKKEKNVTNVSESVPDRFGHIFSFSFSLNKKDMERRYAGRSGCGPMTMALPAVLMMIACGISEVSKWEDESEANVQAGIDNSMRKVCCVTGVEYPTGYDWRETSAGIPAKCSLVVLADAVPIMRIPVGDGYEISPDPESHKMYQGHLYTFFSKNGTTVVKKNGQPLFRYEGDEVLVDMLIRDEAVYTLTGKRSGGFSYRKNGQPLVERLSGNLFGRLWEDGDSVCFSFSHPVVQSDGVEEKCYLSVDSEVKPIGLAPEVDKVWDICSRKGQPVCLVTSRRWNAVVMYEENGRKEITLPHSAQMLSCKMFPADSLIGVECVYSYDDGSCESGIWIEGAEYIRFETGKSISALSYSNGNAYCVLNPDEDEGIIFDAGELYEMPSGYSCMGSRAVAVSDDEMYVAMSSRKGDRPIIWHEGKLDTLKMNGYVCTVSFAGGRTTPPKSTSGTDQH